MILNGCALETNRDHSVIFEIASKYCISDSFVDHKWYSISYKGFPSTVALIRIVVGRGASGKKGMIKWMSETDVVDFK